MQTATRFVNNSQTISNDIKREITDFLAQSLDENNITNAPDALGRAIFSSSYYHHSDKYKMICEGIENAVKTYASSQSLWYAEYVSNPYKILSKKLDNSYIRYSIDHKKWGMFPANTQITKHVTKQGLISSYSLILPTYCIDDSLSVKKIYGFLSSRFLSSIPINDSLSALEELGFCNMGYLIDNIKDMDYKVFSSKKIDIIKLAIYALHDSLRTFEWFLGLLKMAVRTQYLYRDSFTNKGIFTTNFIDSNKEYPVDFVKENLLSEQSNYDKYKDKIKQLMKSIGYNMEMGEEILQFLFSFLYSHKTAKQEIKCMANVNEFVTLPHDMLYLMYLPKENISWIPKFENKGIYSDCGYDISYVASILQDKTYDKQYRWIVWINCALKIAEDINTNQDIDRYQWSEYTEYSEPYVIDGILGSIPFCRLKEYHGKCCYPSPEISGSSKQVLLSVNIMKVLQAMPTTYQGYLDALKNGGYQTGRELFEHACEQCAQ